MACSTAYPPSTSFISNKDLNISAFSSSKLISSQKCKRKSKKICSVMATRKPATTDSVKTGMTMTEKIFARASERTQLSPGENVWVDVDVLMTHDVGGPGSFGIFKEEFGQNAQKSIESDAICHIDGPPPCRSDNIVATQESNVVVEHSHLTQGVQICMHANQYPIFPHTNENMALLLGLSQGGHPNSLYKESEIGNISFLQCMEIMSRVNNIHDGMEVIVCTICIALLQEETMTKSSTKQWKQK